MEHHFTGPSYTIGIEEELMICDAESYDLVNAIESLLEDAAEGEIKPELMESVLEIATEPAPDTAQAGRQLRALRAQVRETAAARGLAIGSAGGRPPPRWGGHRPGRPAAPRASRAGARDRRRARPRDRLGGDAPLRDVGGPAHRRPPALPRPRVLAALRRPPGAHLRRPRACRRRRSRQGHPRRQRHARAPRGPACPQRELAVLAGTDHGPAVRPHADLPRVPARRG